VAILAAAVTLYVLKSPRSTDVDYPDKPITILVHTSPGGGTDAMARVVWKHAEHLTGETFVIENHPGAGGQIGYTRLATSRPDGYTIGAITTVSIVTHELTREGVVYELEKSFRPIARIVHDPSIVAVRSDSPFETLDDLIEAAQRAPGRYTWGGTFLYGAHHVHYLLFRRATAAELQYVPFDGGAATRAALLGGHIDVGSGGVSEFAQLVREGELRMLVVAGSDRFAPLPRVPTYADLGYDVQIGSDRGFAVPADTPEERALFLEQTVARVFENPQFLEEAATIGIGETLSYMNGEGFTGYLRQLQDVMRVLLSEENVLR
jgi:tripartite-type tricarboxylate transporter receptor subunit TctC